MSFWGQREVQVVYQCPRPRSGLPGHRDTTAITRPQTPHAASESAPKQQGPGRRCGWKGVWLLPFTKPPTCARTAQPGSCL